MPQNKEFFHLKSRTVGSAFSLHTRGNLSGGRSLGLITELQDYIEVLENVAASRKVELEKIRDDKHGVEKMLYNFQQKDGNMRQAELFTSLARGDLPPRLRAILEDNRMLADKVRQYKNKCAAAERMIIEQRRQFTNYHDQICKLKKEVTGQSQKAVRKDGLGMDKKKISTLEYQLDVLKKKNQTDSKHNQRLISSLRKENEILYMRIETLKSTAAVKEKEVRMRVIELKQMQRAHLEEKRVWQQSRKSRVARASTAPLPNMEVVKQEDPIVTPKYEEVLLASGVADQIGSQPEPYVMLCIVQDSPQTATVQQATSVKLEPKPGTLLTSDSVPTKLIDHAQAAILIQKEYRKYKARQKEAHCNTCAVVTSLQTKIPDGDATLISCPGKAQSTEVSCRPPGQNEYDRAAVMIQSAVRGMQARRKVDRMRVSKVATNEGASHKVKSTAHQSNWIYRHQQDPKHVKPIVSGDKKRMHG